MFYVYFACFCVCAPRFMPVVRGCAGDVARVMLRG